MKKLISASAMVSALALVSLGLFSCEDSSSSSSDGSKSSNDLSSMDTSGGTWKFTSKSKVVLYSGTYIGNEAAESGELTLTILKASKDGKLCSLVNSELFIFKITKNGFSAKIPAVTLKAESSSGSGSSGGSTTPAEKSVTLLPRQGWFNAEKAGVEASVITKVTFMKEAYTGSSTKNWDAGVTAGEITAYLNGTEVIVSGNGNKIKANADCSDMFIGYEEFCKEEEWRYGFMHRSEIARLKNLDTSDVEIMQWMFAGLKFDTLDLSGFDTSNVTDMNTMFCDTEFEKLILTSFDTSKVKNMDTMFFNCQTEVLDLSTFDTNSGGWSYGMYRMFGGCGEKFLKTIYVSEKFVAPNVTINDIPEEFKSWYSSATDEVIIKSYTSMFSECTNLVGGAGTKWSEDHTDASYARIDGGTSNPGYFTKK